MVSKSEARRPIVQAEGRCREGVLGEGAAKLKRLLFNLDCYRWPLVVLNLVAMRYSKLLMLRRLGSE